MKKPDQCIAESRSMRNDTPHTYRCQLHNNHDGAHEHRETSGRLHMWYAIARPHDVTTAYRFDSMKARAKEFRRRLGTVMRHYSHDL